MATLRNDWMWLVTFCAENFLLNNIPWFGKPVEVNSEEIKTLLEIN